MVDHENGSVPICFSRPYFYDIRWLRRHMAPGAIPFQKRNIPGIGYFAKIMINGIVTALAALSIPCVVAMVIDMDVMAGRTIHLTHAEAFAGCQQCNLVTVHVWPDGGDMIRQYKMSKRIARSEAEHRPQLDTFVAAVTYGTHIDLLFARQVLIRHDIPALHFIRIFRMEAHMIGRRAMTSFTINIQDHRSFIQGIFILSVGLGDERSMAFKTSFQHGPVEESHAGWVPRATGPPVQACKPGNRKLI